MEVIFRSTASESFHERLLRFSQYSREGGMVSVVTHDDLDGVTAGLLLQKYFFPASTVRFVSYEALPDLLADLQNSQDSVVIADLSVAKPEILPPGALLIDHHASTELTSRAYPERVYHRMDMSAAMMVWTLVFELLSERRGEAIEDFPLVRIVHERDLWIAPERGFSLVAVLKEVGVEPFARALVEVGFSVERVLAFFRSDLERAMSEYREVKNRLQDRMRRVSYGEHRGAVVIAEGNDLGFLSDVAHDLMRDHVLDFIAFAVPRDDVIKLSFRSRGDFDVLLLAEALGGGGHPKACGAVLRTSLDEAVAALGNLGLRPV